MGKVLVLASGGIDSTCLLYSRVAHEGAANVVALSVFYGQKHAKELEYLKYHTDKLGVQLLHQDLSEVFKFNRNSSALLQGSSKQIVHKSYAEQQADAPGVVSAYVPFRNGLFLSYAAAVALQLDAGMIYYGAHADDAAGNAYPDCSGEFIEHMDQAIFLGTGNKVSLQAPWWDMNKASVVHQGMKYGMTQKDFDHTWSCYEGGAEPCGTCGTCIDRRAALEANGLRG